MYLENNLCVPNRLTMCDTPVDLGRIDMPSYVLATQEDHIVPWRSAYRTTQLVGGQVAVRPRRQRPHRRRDQSRVEEQAQLLDRRHAGRRCRSNGWHRRRRYQGSWWTHWMKWLKPQAGKPVPGAQAARQREAQADRTRARALCEGTR